MPSPTIPSDISRSPIATLLSTAALLAVVVFSRSALAQGGLPPAKVFLETTKLELLSDARAVTGDIRSRRTSELATQVAGLAIEVLVEEGDEVKSGQVVAKLDDERASLEIARARAQHDSDAALVQQATSELEQAERDLGRLEELDSRGSAGPAQLDQARTLVKSRAATLAEARAKLAISQSDLELAIIELKDMSILAPFAGRVIHKHAEVGQWVDRGDPICTIVSMDDLEARIDVSQSLLPALEAANKATGKRPTVELVLPSFAEPMKASVLAVVPQADELSRLFPVRLEVEDPDQVLRPGMSLTAMVPTGTQAELLTVSKDAILRGPAGEHVFYNNNGVSAMAPITRLFSVGNRVVIRSPLIQPGMQVVVEGNERMSPNQTLIIIQIDGKPAPRPEAVQPNAGASGTEG